MIDRPTARRRTVVCSRALQTGSPAGAADTLALAVDEPKMQYGRQNRHDTVQDFEGPARAVIQQRYEQLTADLKTGAAQ